MKSALKFPLILFFLKDAMPTLEEQHEADQLAPCRVAFRNARMANAPGALEQCDGVAGEVPERYAEKYPTAEEAMTKYMEEREQFFATRQKAIDDAKVRAAEAAEAAADAENKKAAEMASKAKDHAENTKAKAEAAKAKAAEVKATTAGKPTAEGEKAAAAWKAN